MAVIYDKNEYSVYPSSDGTFYDFFLEKNNTDAGVLRVEKLLYELPEDKARIVLKNTVFNGSELRSAEKEPEKIKDIEIIFENNEDINRFTLKVESGAKVSVKNNEGVCVVGASPLRILENLVIENNKNFKMYVDDSIYLSGEPLIVKEAVIKNCTLNSLPSSEVSFLAIMYNKGDVFNLFIKDVYIDDADGSPTRMAHIFLKIYASDERFHNYRIEGVKLNRTLEGIDCHGANNLTLKNVALEDGSKLHIYSNDAEIFVSDYVGNKTSALHLVLSKSNKPSIFLKNCSSDEDSKLLLKCEQSDNIVLENIGVIRGAEFKKSNARSLVFSYDTEVNCKGCELILRNIEELNLAGYFSSTKSFRIEDSKKVDIQLNNCQLDGEYEKADNSQGRITLDAAGCDNLIFKGNPTQIYGETSLIAKGANIDVRKLALLSVNTKMSVTAKEGDVIKMRDVDAAGNFEIEGSANLNFVHMSQFGNNLKVCDSTLEKVIFNLEGDTITKTEIRDSNLESVKIKNKTAGEESTVEIIQSDISESAIRENCKIESSELNGADLQPDTKIIEFFHHSKVRTKLEGNLCNKALSCEKNKPAKVQAEAHTHISTDELEL